MSQNRIAPLPPSVVIREQQQDVKGAAQLARTPDGSQPPARSSNARQLPPLPGVAVRSSPLPNAATPLSQQQPAPAPAMQAMQATPHAPSQSGSGSAPGSGTNQQPLAQVQAPGTVSAMPVHAAEPAYAGQAPSAQQEATPNASDGLPSSMLALLQSSQQFIPFRYVEVRESLIKDYPQIFKQDEMKALFVKLSKWLAMRNSMRIALAFDDVYDLFSLVDPDNDMPAGLMITEELAEGYIAKFQKMFLDVLSKGNFVELDQSVVASSYGGDGFMGTGIAVQPVDTEFLQFRVWFRGLELKTVYYRTWRTFFIKKSQRVIQFDRLLILYRKRPGSELKASEQKVGPLKRMWRGIFNFMFSPKELSCSSDMQEGRLYLKFFRDVKDSDIDIMLPGAEAKFSWLDYALIFGSMLAAIGGAVYKAVSGTIRFDTLVNILSTLVLIMMPLYGAYKGYISIKDKMQDLQFHVNRLFVTHNLSSNSGVIAALLDEAQEQEDKESLLAYFFLWQGLTNPSAVSKEDLDRNAETYLNNLARRQGLEVKFDFEVVDGIEKLHRMGILEEEGQEPTLYKVLPLDKAVVNAHINKFDEEREVQGVRRRHLDGISEGLLWHECMATYPDTGQKFRYFWNVKTGESTYSKPKDYIPLADAFEGLMAPRPLAGPAAAAAMGLPGAVGTAVSGDKEVKKL